MAPEQLMGEAVDARSDLYSAGMVLYECLAGRLPYEAATPMLLLAKRLSNAPEPLERVNPAVPAPVAALVMRLLAWAPEQRFASASDLGREVARLAS
jgi:serine/threonine-protein kinase